MGGSRFSALTQRVGMKAVVYTTLAVLTGALIGLGLFTFGYADGWAYLGNDPQACANCHAMNEEYAGWTKSSHKAAATCNDCHAPHDNVVHKYASKAENGFWHSLKFTTGDYPENIEMRDVNRRVTEQACLHCHSDLVESIGMGRHGGDEISCIRCHNEVGHMR